MKSITQYLSQKNRLKHLRLLTVIAFFALTVEKLLEGETFVYQNGRIDAFYTINALDLVCVLVYFSTALLLLADVRNKILLFPDSMLLAVKVMHVCYCLSVLLRTETLTKIEVFTYAEKICEGVSFALFLVILFVGKLQKSDNKFHRIYPYICLALLVFCFAVTLGFEIGKLFVATADNLGQTLTMINFAKSVIGEAFLDLPYFLLTLSVCFVGCKEKAEIKL
jgi:hypothetical protein